MTQRLRRRAQGLLRALDRQAARAYVVGPSLADGMRACRSLTALGIRTTICYWSGEDDAPRDIAERYVAAIDAIGLEGLNCYASMKAPPLGFSRDLVARIAERARERRVGIHFDSLSPDDTDHTFSLIEEMIPRHDDLGCTLPGRWQRSIADADRAVDLHLRVRIVKGQWADSDGHDLDPRQGFLGVVDRLAGRVRHAAVATHDPILAREALRRLRAAGTPCELELWFGLPIRRAIRSALAIGVPIRMYVPYGHGSLPYAMWQAKEHPHIAWWACRDLYAAAKFRISRSPGVDMRYGFLKTLKA